MTKLAFLEDRLGHKASYRVLQPFSMNPRNIIDVQHAAKKLADFAGLHDLVFIVSINKQKANVAGHIDLQDDGNEVFIELSPDTSAFYDATLATLAHEVAHKYLHVNGISVGDGLSNEYENELLTDMTAIFLGFGKLILNGCECQRTVGTGKQTITQTLTTGYLGLEQAVFVYLLICAMRNITPLGNLSPEVLKVLQLSQKAHAQYFDPVLHDPNAKSDLVGDLRHDALEVQQILSSIDEKLLVITETTTSPAAAFVANARQQLTQLDETSRRSVDSNPFNPCQKYLSALALRRLVQESRTDALALLADANAHNKRLTRVADFLQRLGPSVSPAHPRKDAPTVKSFFQKK